MNILLENPLLHEIAAANPGRHVDTLNRRALKLIEELGEVSEAYLNVTSQQNAKGKTWADVREELVDLLIVVGDCLLTPFPGEEGMSPADLERRITEVTLVKLAKWKRALAAGQSQTQQF